MLRSWQEISDILPKLAKIDLGYDHIRNLLQYSLTFIDQNDKIELEKVLINNLSKEKGDELMTSLAQSWKEEGIQVGKAEGIQIGEAKGKAERNIEIARKMLANGSKPVFISIVTGLDETFILSLIKS